MYNLIVYLMVWFVCVKLGVIWLLINVLVINWDLLYMFNDLMVMVLIIDLEFIELVVVVFDEMLVCVVVVCGEEWIVKVVGLVFW